MYFNLYGTFPIKSNDVTFISIALLKWIKKGEGAKSLRGRGSCHLTCHRYVCLPVAAATRPATSKCACHRTCHRYVRLPPDLPPLFAPAMLPVTAECACLTTQLASTLGAVLAEMRHCRLSLDIGGKIMGQSRADSTKRFWLTAGFFYLGRSRLKAVVRAAGPHSV